MSEDKPAAPSGWRRVLAIMLDMVLVFVGLGFGVGWATGGLTPNGFTLSGWPALLFYALGFAYFTIGWNYAGGTIGDRLMRIPRPRKA
jgi:hypothetical protein